MVNKKARLKSSCKVIRLQQYGEGVYHCFFDVVGGNKEFSCQGKEKE